MLDAGRQESAQMKKRRRIDNVVYIQDETPAGRLEALRATTGQRLPILGTAPNGSIAALLITDDDEPLVVVFPAQS